MIKMLIKETIFDSSVNEIIKERYDDVIDEMKEDGIYTKEKADQEMNLAYYFGTVGFPCV